MTTNRTFEDPRKTDLRERLRVALEASGLALVEPPVKVAPPPAAQLMGHIIGDLQALDSKAVRHAFYLQLRGDKAIPQWLASYASAAHGLEDVRVHVVVEQSTSILERSCHAAGAGLLELSSEGEYELRTIIDGHEYSPEARAAEYAGKVKDLRRRIETKMESHLDGLKVQHAKIPENTKGMSTATQDKYVRAVEGEMHRWREWGDRLVGLLETGLAENNDEILLIVAKDLELGVAKAE